MNRSAEVGQVLEFIGKVNEPALKFALVRALGEGLQHAGGKLDRGGVVGEVFTAAVNVAVDAQAPEPARVQAIQLLGLTSYGESGARLLSLLDSQQPQVVQLAAIATLARFNDPQVGPELTKRWSTLTPRLRSEALAALLARPERARALLEAIAAGTIQPAVLDSMQTKFLVNHRNKEVRELAVKVLAAQPASTRQQVIDALMPALNLKGDPTHGKKIYEERCISCHRLGGQGFALGPDLVTVKNTGKEKMLVNILDPNREVRPDFTSYLIETKDDESYIGLVVNETGGAVTLRQAYGKEEVIRRSNIRKMQSSSQSLMPEGLEAGLATQDLADLLEYIETAEAK
jgi:putative heme-binding domain-containing protein